MFVYGTALILLARILPAALAAESITFEPAAFSPTSTSTNYIGQTNGSLTPQPVVKGKAFDRFIQIWMENTDFESANSTAEFRALAAQGILMDQYYALTHPSEPNYVATVGGSFWGMGDDNFYNIPTNISTMVDLLELKNISWASYQENMPTDGYAGFTFTSPNYIDPTSPPYTYYARKHNPTIIYDSVATVPSRAPLHRNFNDFAADINASALPQWMFVTPNLVNDAHDTTIDFGGQWLQFWLMPLLNDSRFNTDRTLILLTFDENETSNVNNRVFSVLLGGAVPAHLRGTVDHTYFTHYSAMSTVQANWGLGSLGRGDTDKVMSNVYSMVASATGYKNLNVSGSQIPLTNASGKTPGPLNPSMFVPFPPPNTSAIGAGGGPVFVSPNAIVGAAAPAPINLTALNETVPALNTSDPDAASTPAAASAPSASTTATSNAVRFDLTLSAIVTALVGYLLVFAISY